MRRLIIIFAVIFSAIAMLAESNPFLELFRKHFPNTYSDTNIKNIKSFVGDSIYFDIQGGYALNNVFQETPDTVWIKEKKSKKPKEGKNFLLCYNYKGIRDGKTFFTPASQFDNCTFGLLSVKEIKEGSYFPETVGYDLSLIEPVTANVIHVILDKSLPSNWRLYSKNSNALINRWIGTHFFKKSNYGSDLTDYTLTHGELFLEIRLVGSTMFLSPHGEFILRSNNAEPLNLSYDSNSGMSYSIEGMKFLSQSEYDKELEKSKIYTINYDLPQDSTFKAKLELLPFKAIWGKTNS